MQHPRITEVLANPSGTDKGNEWVELCAGPEGANLGAYTLQIAARKLTLSGSLDPNTCSIARTGTAAVRNREADVSLLYKGAVIQEITTAGSAPENFGFHIASSSFWSTSTPGLPLGTPAPLPPLPNLNTGSILPGLLGTAACTAGILTALALFALRYARDRHYAPEGGDPAPRR